MDTQNWKFLAEIGSILGQPVAPEFEAIVMDYYLAGRDHKTTANLVRDMMEANERERTRVRLMLKSTN